MDTFHLGKGAEAAGLITGSRPTRVPIAVYLRNRVGNLVKPEQSLKMRVGRFSARTQVFSTLALSRGTHPKCGLRDQPLCQRSDDASLSLIPLSNFSATALQEKRSCASCTALRLNDLHFSTSPSNVISCFASVSKSPAFTR